MPTETLLMSIAVVAVFVVFGVALAWADRQTSPARLKPNDATSKPRVV